LPHIIIIAQRTQLVATFNVANREPAAASACSGAPPALAAAEAAQLLFRFHG